MWFESKDNRHYTEKQEMLVKTDFFIYGGRTWKGPNPRGRNLWGSNPKRAETSGNRAKRSFMLKQFVRVNLRDTKTLVLRTL